MNKKHLHTIQSKFTETFLKDPILIFSPGRINLIGEHTDYNNGFVFPAAIDKGIYAAIEKTENDFCTIIALDINKTITFSLDAVQAAKKGSWQNYVLGVVSEILKAGKKLTNFNLIFSGDIPSGAGLSSSAALENAVAFGLNELFALEFSKEEMIFISQKAEHNFVGVQCGIMDQYASMFGEHNNAILLDCVDLTAKYVAINFGEYEIILINTNVKHSLSSSAYNDRRMVCEKVATLLKATSLRGISKVDLATVKHLIAEDDYQKALYVLEENSRVLKAYEAIKSNDLMLLGNLLFESHTGLQHQYKVSCKELDFLIDQAKKHPEIIGARMMGGGFGGCTINIIKREFINDFKTQIKALYKKEFHKICSIYEVTLSGGTQRLNTGMY